MDSGDCSDSPWENYQRRINLNDLDTASDPVQADNKVTWLSSDGESTKLSPNDMHMYGYCPVAEELNVTKCDKCGSILLPSALKSHIDKRHAAEQKALPEAVVKVEYMDFNVASCSKNYSHTFKTEVAQESQWTYMSNSTFVPSSVPTSAPVTNRVVDMKSNVPIATEPEVFDVVDDDDEDGDDSDDMSTPESASPTRNILTRIELSLYGASRTIPSTSSSADYYSPLTMNSSVQPPPMPPHVMYNCDVLQSSKPSSTTSICDAAPEEKKPEKLEKIVLRRVPQSCDRSSDDKRKSAEGREGTSRKKSNAPFFVVVRNKETSQNLFHTSKQLMQQSHKVYQDKSVVDKNLKILNNAKDKLITKLYMELQSMKKKLNQSKKSKKELRSKFLMLSEELKELKKISDTQCEVLTNRNVTYLREINTLRARLDQLTARKQAARQMYQYLSNEHFFPNDAHYQPDLSQGMQVADPDTTWFETRLRDLEEKMTHTRNSKKQLETDVTQFIEIIRDMTSYNLVMGGVSSHEPYYNRSHCSSDSFEPVLQYSSPSQSNLPGCTSPEGMPQNAEAIDYRTYKRSRMTCDTEEDEVS